MARQAASLALLIVGALALPAYAATLTTTPAPEGSTSPAAPPVPADPSILRVCASGNQQPYSAKDGSGFENKIAMIVAEAMGRKAVFVYADKPAIYLVRDWLDKKKCDVVIGIDTNDQRVLTTKPYYRAGYVFVTKRSKALDFDSWNDPKIKTLGHIVVDLGSPSEMMLKELGKYNDNMAYLYSLVGFRAPRNEYVQIPPQKMIGEVESGEADLAAGFAPDVARFVKADPDLKMVSIKDDATHNGGEKLPQQYDQSMGVRIGDTSLQGALDTALVKARPAIEATLKGEGIPIAEATN